MKVEMKQNDKHLDVWLDEPSQSFQQFRQVIIDKEHNDVRITDHQNIMKVRFTKDGKLKDILVNDVFVHTFCAIQRNKP